MIGGPRGGTVFDIPGRDRQVRLADGSITDEFRLKGCPKYSNEPGTLSMAVRWSIGLCHVSLM